MSRYVCSTLFFLFLLANDIQAHAEFWLYRDYRNIQVRVQSGYVFEETYHAFTIGKLAEKLCRQLRYSKTIYLDFHHQYGRNNGASTYFISFDNGKITYPDDISEKYYFLAKKAIVIRIIARQYDIPATLRLVEYAIRNVQRIPLEQKVIHYKGIGREWRINSLDSAEIAKALLQPNNSAVDSVLHQRVERPERDMYRALNDMRESTDPEPKEHLKRGISYYWQNNIYTVFSINYQRKDTSVLQLPSIYQLERISDRQALVFDTDSSFYFIDMYFKTEVSKRHIITNMSIKRFWRPYIVEPIGHNMVSIVFTFPYPKKKSILPDRIVIYRIEEDDILQDLDELIEQSRK